VNRLAKHSKLTKTERLLLSSWKKEGLSNIECGKRLGRDKSTIGRELNRNKTKVWVGKSDEYIYEPAHAQFVALERRQKAFDSKQPLKNRDIYGYVLDHLRQGWSPEQIAGRLRKVDHPKDSHWSICHETIYSFIYKEKTELTRQRLKTQAILNQKLKSKAQRAVTVTDSEKPLFEYLRRKQVRRRVRGGRKAQRIRIPDRVSIHDRPKVVDTRLEIGHWEGDSIVGLGHKNGLHTEYERVSSLIRLQRMNSLTTKEAISAAARIFKPLPDALRRTTTWDNGSEHTNHKELTKRAGILVFFADPYSAYQRGGNENANLWIRYYFPKRTDFSTVSDEELADVERELNNRPRKRLEYKTPQEVFNLHLRGCSSY
jgi:IS30 family transposase